MLSKTIFYVIYYFKHNILTLKELNIFEQFDFSTKISMNKIS